MGYAVGMWWCWTLLACSGGPSPDPGPDGGSGSDTATDASPEEIPVAWSVAEAPHAGNVFQLDWTPSDRLDQLTVRIDDEVFVWDDPVPPLSLMGLPPGRAALAELTGPGGATSDALAFPTAEVPAPLRSLVLEEASADSEAGQGWVLTNVYERDPASGYALILDGQGRPVWWKEAPDALKSVRARLSHDGTAVVWAVTDWELDDDIALIGRTSLDGRTEALRAAPGLHHDVLEDGDRYHYLAFQVDESLPFGFNDAFPAVADVVRSVPVAADTPVEEGFAFFDDYPFPPYEACSHADFPSFHPTGVEWTHSNSLVTAPQGGLYVMARYLDALVHVDAEGAFAWQIGGRDATLHPVDPAHEAFHGHFTHAWDDRVLVFDNHSHVDGPSRVMEWRIDAAAGTYEAVWTHEEPGGGKITFLGDARRMPGGHTLIAWSPRGELEEVRPDGTTAWRVDSPVLVTGRVAFEPGLPFARPAAAPTP